MPRPAKSSNPFSSTLPGFTLIELAMVLMIIGLIAGAIFKGQDLLDSAKVRAVLSDVHRFRLATTLYQETYGYLPGNDPKATTHFGSGYENGKGDGKISAEDNKRFWVHLNRAGYINYSAPPSSKLGGVYSVTCDPTAEMPGNWIQLGAINGDKNNGGLLTPKQAQLLKSKGEEGSVNDLKQGLVRFREGDGITAGQCIKDGHFNLEVSAPTCVMFAALN